MAPEIRIEHPQRLLRRSRNDGLDGLPRCGMPLRERAEVDGIRHASSLEGLWKCLDIIPRGFFRNLVRRIAIRAQDHVHDSCWRVAVDLYEIRSHPRRIEVLDRTRAEIVPSDAGNHPGGSPECMDMQCKIHRSTTHGRTFRKKVPQHLTHGQDYWLNNLRHNSLIPPSARCGEPEAAFVPFA